MKKFRDKLVDARYIGPIALIFLLLCFVDVLWISDGNNLKDMSRFGQISLWIFYVTLGWIVIFSAIMPGIYRLIQLFKKKDDLDDLRIPKRKP